MALDGIRTALPFHKTDGGRRGAGYTGSRAGDCVTRAVAIGTQQDYGIVYDTLSAGSRTQRLTKRSKRKVSARNGVNVKRKWFKDYMASFGWEYVSCCRNLYQVVHLCAEELGKNLPDNETLICMVTGGKGGHYTTLVNGVVHDSWNPSAPRETRYGTSKCRVYGYWQQRQSTS